MKTFEAALREHNIELKRESIKILQVNIGKRCNQACHHCHVESGPNRTENMELATVERLLELLKKEPQIHTVDFTGGAPELNPHFRYFVTEIRKMGKEVIDRCNLTVFFEEGQSDTPEFLAENKIQVVASLPCYKEDNVDKQRGKGVFGKSVSALEKLNSLGYGKEGSGLILNLVYNPVGEHLPPAQANLEADYHAHLKDEFGIVFNHLFTITNMPIKRYAHMLERDGKMKYYMQLLIDNFNPQAAKGVMCTELISIGWDGQIYDCDFNQMLEIPLNWQPRNLWDIERFSNIESGIAVASHCFGCTAGSGSSCGGALL
ncbi:MAG: radical SAM protein [Alphaproteobacteria bacterium CG11_big_fil_rev_8_21_14_0_20_39_49]|nr:MAG: radical SAM protein [Alphaproteobacteria bacterium CG11_big_fil_rev_8_21_14_0_20_39_49]